MASFLILADWHSTCSCPATHCSKSYVLVANSQSVSQN